MRWPIVIMLGAALPTGGCASLNVNVDVMNPAYAKASMLEASLRIEGSELALGGHRQADEASFRMWGAYETFRQACLTERIAETVANRALFAPRVFDQQIANLKMLRDGAEARLEVADQQRLSQAALYKADANVLTFMHGAQPSAIGLEGIDKPLDGALRASLIARRDSYEAEGVRVKSYIGGKAAECKGAVAAAAAGAPANPVANKKIDEAASLAQGRVETALAQSITGGGVLMNNMLEAFYVTKAAEPYWAPRYNRAYGRGYGGSSSIAIKMNDTADFSVKGFVFDGRATAEMVKKVGVQAVSIIAASYGAPMGLAKPAGSSATGATYFDTQKLVSDTDSAVITARARQAAYQATLFRVADSILSNWDPLVAGDTTAKGIVSSGFDAYKNSWKAPETQP